MQDPQPTRGLSSGSPADKREEGMYEQGVKILTGKPTEIAFWDNGNSWLLNKQLGRFHGTDFGPLYVDDS